MFDVKSLVIEKESVVAARAARREVIETIRNTAAAVYGCIFVFSLVMVVIERI